MTSVNAQHEALLDALLKDYTNPQDLLGEHGLLKQLTKRLVERALEAELTAHLGYAPHVRHGIEEHNARHGKGHQTVQTDTGPLEVLLQILLRRSCRGNCPCLWRGLGGQGVEQFGRSEAFVSLLDYQLPFLDHVHEFDADERGLRRVKRFEP